SFLSGDLFAFPSRGTDTRALSEAGEPTLFVSELGRNNIVLKLEEAITRQAVSVEPYTVPVRWHSELPKDGRFASALRVVLEGMLEETRGQPRAKFMILSVK